MKKPLLIVIIVIAVLGVSLYFLKRDKGELIPVETPIVIPPEEEIVVGPTAFCYERFSAPNEYGAIDKYTLRMIIDGNKATGELNFLPAEKDRKIGEFEGTVTPVNQTTKSRTANLWWFTSGEGMNVKEELKILLEEGEASIGFGEMTEREDGSYVYKDPANVSYNLKLTGIPCDDLTERVNVEAYLRENISELSPVKPVFGGAWYLVSVTVEMDKNTGTVTYEDGHIQENRTFSYSTNDKREVTSLTIK